MLTLALADHSMPAWVDSELVISGHPPPTDETDNQDYEPTFTIPICCDLCELKPGSESAINIRLDDGPMRPHLVNEYVDVCSSTFFFSLKLDSRSQALVDSEGTLHAQFTVRLSRPIRSVLLSPSIDLSISDTMSQASSALETVTSETTMSWRSERTPTPPPSPKPSPKPSSIPPSTPSSFSKKWKKRSGDESAPVYTSLRRGGR